MTAVITLRNVSRSYISGHPAVDGISLSVAPGEVLALLGPSGCGKTTTLRLISGLEQPDAGELWLAGKQVAGNGHWIPPEGRQVGVVFQDYALFPHLTVADNLAFPLVRWPRADCQQRIAELLALTGLEGLDTRYPHQLSGGQQQRVALARALAPQPALLLLDEPFSNLDAALRVEMREELRRIVRAAGTTTVFVTHDQEEALSLADTVAVMFTGQLVQIGTPLTIYQNPVNRAVATFVGDANFLPGLAQGDHVLCALGLLPLAQAATGPVDVLIRPESLQITPDVLGSRCVERIVFYGHDQLVYLSLPDGTILKARTRPHPTLAAGMFVNVHVHDSVVAFPSCGNELTIFPQKAYA